MVLRLRFPNRAWWAQWLLGICFLIVLKVKDPPWFAGLSTRSVADSVAVKIRLFVKPTKNFEGLFFFALNFVE